MALRRIWRKFGRDRDWRETPEMSRLLNRAESLWWFKQRFGDHRQMPTDEEFEARWQAWKAAGDLWDGPPYNKDDWFAGKKEEEIRHPCKHLVRYMPAP